MSISLIDYGCGNIGSVMNMVNHVGSSINIVKESSELKKARKIILPGVGKWDTGMHNLKEKGMLDILINKVKLEQVPILGICLGMQLLLNESEEGILPGLGLIEGKVKKFNFSRYEKKYPIPHMGWNRVISKKESIFNASLDQKTKFYFVHSFYAEPSDKNNILFQTDYVHSFVSGVEKENVYGLQFHPEKSHKHGMGILKSFIKI